MSAIEVTNKKPLVTIVTITFNLKKSEREKTFRQCLESVHNQSYPNIEHLIIDGASTDGTLDIIKEYKKKGWIKYISEPDKGIYDAMNKGIEAAEGKYLAFLHTDDFYHNEKAVETSVNALEKSKADFSYANYVVVGKDQKYIDRGDIERFLYVMPFGHPTMFTKTAVLRSENGFDISLGMPADYDLVIRLILKDYKSVYIDEEIVTYRLCGAGTLADNSDKIAETYLKNFSVFYNLSSIKQAKKIRYQNVLPRGFAESFAEYAKEKKMKNINLQSIMSKLESLAPRKKSEVMLEGLKNYLKRYAIIVKLWKTFK